MVFLIPWTTPMEIFAHFVPMLFKSLHHPGSCCVIWRPITLWPESPIFSESGERRKGSCTTLEMKWEVVDFMSTGSAPGTVSSKQLAPSSPLPAEVWVKPFSPEGLGGEEGVWEPGSTVHVWPVPVCRHTKPHHKGWSRWTLFHFRGQKTSDCGVVGYNSQNRVWAPLASLVEKAEVCCLGKLFVDHRHWEFKEPDFSSTPWLVLKGNLFVC